MLEKIKTLNDKIESNEVQYKLYRETAKNSTLCSSNLGKYEYLTLAPNPEVIQQKQVEYSPLQANVNNKTNQIKTVKGKKNLSYE